MGAAARRLVIVGDTEPHRLSIRALLERGRDSSYLIEEVDAGELAVATCERFLPDCVLFSERPPDEDWLERLSELRRRDGSVQFAVVLLTDSGQDEARARALQAGVEDYLPKNEVSESLLERVIENALNKAALARQRQKYIEAREADERDVRALVDSLPCVVYTVDLVERQRIFVSRFSEDLLGYAAAEIAEMGAAKLLGLVHEDDRADVQKHASRLRLARNGEILGCEFRIQHRNGDWRRLSVRDRIVARDGIGAATLAAGAAIEISNGGEMENELRECRVQLDAAQEASGIGMWAWDAQTEKLTCSARCVKLYGRKGEEASGSEIWDEWIYADDRTRLAEDLARGLTGDGFESEFRTVWPDGSLHWLYSHGTMSSDAAGPGHLIGATLDLTEKKRMQEELRRANEELERFAYIASHDLQEPLRTISSFSELLARRNKEMEGESKQLLEYIRQGGRQMQALVSDLLTFSRVTQAAREPLEDVDSNEALAEALSALQPSISGSNAEIQADELPRITANFQQLAQLFQNLVGNGIKYRGERAPVVKLTSQRLPRAWQFCVSDNGIGFDMTYAERIFEAFKRLHSRDQYSGTGIGLAICRRIVERHGGRIWAESEPGAGARFLFTISDAPEAAIPG